MSFKITGDSIEFLGSVEDFKREVSIEFSNRDVPAHLLAKKHKVTIKTLYNWAHKYDTFLAMNTRRYKITQKLKLIMEYDALEGNEVGSFLRSHALTDADIKIWKKELEEIDSFFPPEFPELTEEVKVKLIKKDLKRTREALKEKEKELRKRDKELKEAKAIIDLKKKAEILFGKKEEE